MQPQSPSAPGTLPTFNGLPYGQMNLNPYGDSFGPQATFATGGTGDASAGDTNFVSADQIPTVTAIGANFVAAAPIDIPSDLQTVSSSLNVLDDGKAALSDGSNDGQEVVVTADPRNLSNQSDAGGPDSSSSNQYGRANLYGGTLIDVSSPFSSASIIYELATKWLDRFETASTVLETGKSIIEANTDKYNGDLSAVRNGVNVLSNGWVESEVNFPDGHSNITAQIIVTPYGVMLTKPGGDLFYSPPFNSGGGVTEGGLDLNGAKPYIVLPPPVDVINNNWNQWNNMEYLTYRNETYNLDNGAIAQGALGFVNLFSPAPGGFTGFVVGKGAEQFLGYTDSIPGYDAAQTGAIRQAAIQLRMYQLSKVGR